MLELALAVHLAVPKLTLVLVTLCPIESTSTLHNVFFKLSLESAPISEHCESLPVLHVPVPVAFVLCQHTIYVS